LRSLHIDILSGHLGSNGQLSGGKDAYKESPGKPAVFSYVCRRSAQESLGSIRTVLACTDAKVR